MNRFFLGILFSSLLLGNVQAELVGHWPMNKTKPIRIVWDADNGNDDTWRTAYSTTAPTANIPIITLPDGNKVWEKTAYNGLFSSSLIAIDPSKKYRLTGTFRSNGSIDSKVYFGFLPILEDGTNSTQSSSNSFRRGDDGIIQSWDDTSITLNNSPTGWYTSTSYVSRKMGFYYDGNTNRLPDFIMYSSAYGATRGTYDTISESTINLSYPIPAEISSNFIPGVSVVKNHYGGCGSYLYSVLSGNILPQTWNTYSDISTGDGWTQTQCEAFRPFTRFVRIMMLPNYAQSSTSVLQFDQIILEEVQGDETDTDGSFKTYDNAPFHTIAIDSRHHGSNHGPVYSKGPNGADSSAMSFDGVDDYIDIDNSQTITFPQVSLSLWVKNTADQTLQDLISKNNPTDYWMIIDTDNKIRFYTGGTSNNNAAFSSTSLNTNEWYHVAGVYDGTDTKIYINGNYEGSAITPLSPAIGSNRITIGKGYSNDRYFNGSLSDVQIYDHALSQTEISKLYASKKVTFNTATSLSTESTNQTATPDLLYWDITNKKYWVGQFNGSLSAVTAPTNAFKNTTELTAIQTGQTATDGLLYWDTEQKKYFMGQPSGGLRPLNE